MAVCCYCCCCLGKLSLTYTFAHVPYQVDLLSIVEHIDGSLQACQAPPASGVCEELAPGLLAALSVVAKLAGPYLASHDEELSALLRCVLPVLGDSSLETRLQAAEVVQHVRLWWLSLFPML